MPVKRNDLLKKFFDKGWWVLREGSRHTIVTNGKDTEAVPRHRELNEKLAQAIIRRRGL